MTTLTPTPPSIPPRHRFEVHTAFEPVFSTSQDGDGAFPPVPTAYLEKRTLVVSQTVDVLESVARRERAMKTPFGAAKTAKNNEAQVSREEVKIDDPDYL